MFLARLSRLVVRRRPLLANATVKLKVRQFRLAFAGDQKLGAAHLLQLYLLVTH